MNFVGLDLSLSSTGLVVISEDYSILLQKLISSSPKDQIEHRISSICDQIFSEIKLYEPCIICVEDLSFSSRGRAILDIAGLNLFVRTCLYNEQKKFYTVAPTVLKKFVCNTGKAKKELMLLKVYQKFGIEFDNNNLADSYSLARFCKDNYGDN